jgi:hypothetical protein
MQLKACGCICFRLQRSAFGCIEFAYGVQRAAVFVFAFGLQLEACSCICFRLSAFGFLHLIVIVFTFSLHPSTFSFRLVACFWNMLQFHQLTIGHSPLTIHRHAAIPNKTQSTS